MKQELIAIRNNVASIGTQVKDVAEGLVGVQRAGIDTASSIGLALLVISSGGLEAAAGKIDEVTEMVR